MFLAELKKKAKQIVYAYFAPNFQTTVQLDNVYVALSNTFNFNNKLFIVGTSKTRWLWPRTSDGARGTSNDEPWGHASTSICR